MVVVQVQVRGGSLAQGPIPLRVPCLFASGRTGTPTSPLPPPQVPLTGPDGQRAYVSVSVVKPLGQGRGAPRPRDLDSSRILAAMQAALPEALARAAGEEGEGGG